MELLGPIKAFLAVALIRVSPSIGDGNVGDLSTVSESFEQPNVKFASRFEVSSFYFYSRIFQLYGDNFNVDIFLD